MPDLNPTANVNVKVSLLGFMGSPIEGVLEVAAEVCFMFCWGMTVVVLMATYYGKNSPEYWDCKGTENCLQRSSTWEAMVPSIIPGL